MLLLSSALFDSAAMAPGPGSRLPTVATTRLHYSAIGRRARPSRHTTVKNDASPSQRPETATQMVGGTGLEPVTPSVSANSGEPLCYATFVQVGSDRTCCS